MEADWDEIARIAVPASGLLGLSNPATAIAFDDLQELLWIGTDLGRVVSYHGSELSRYTSVKAHLNEGQVRQFLVHEKGIISLSFRSVHMISRRGLTQWHITHPDMTELRCMSFTSHPSHVLVAGTQSTFFIIDIDKGHIVSQNPAQARYTIMKKSRYICAATDDGMVHVMNLSDYSVIKSWKAHSAAVNDMDARNDFLVTCGFSVRQLGVPLVDPLANVYDLKNLKPLPPIPFHAGAAYIRLHPKLQTTSFVASQTGQMQMVDLMNPVSIVLRQANVQFMLGMEIAPSGNAVVISDTNGLIYMWGSPNKIIRFNSISKETEFAHPISQSLPTVDWNDTPLNTVGIPYYSDKLLSAWPSSMIFEVGAPPALINPNILPYLQPAEIGQYGPNIMRGKLRRYQVEDTRSDQAPVVIAAPKFLSEKTREALSRDETELTPLEASEMLSAASLNGRAPNERDRMLKYSNVEIKYSRFGVDDFDFRYYNKTEFSGLETHISNSFVNSLLQLYKFIPLLRNLAIQHTATACVLPNCLLCELGFLFDMLEKAAGQNCQATNLLRAFSASREAAHLNIFEDSAFASPAALSNTIQAVNRFILKQISHDYASLAGSVEGLDEVLATSALESIRCMYCGNETTKPGRLYVHDLLYPAIDPKHALRNPNLTFSNILKATIERETKNRGWCNKCRRYQQLAIRKSVQRVPNVFMINTAISNPSMRALWETPGWLPTEIGLSLQGRNTYCFEGQDLNQARSKANGMVIYELVGYVSEIDTVDRQQPHLVSMINVDVSSPKSPSGPLRNWHLFNDFLVSPVDPREAINFNKAWKMPCILAYQIKSAHGRIDDTWKDRLDVSLLHQPFSMNGIAATTQCEILQYEEKPSTGTPIALDTEFVELEKAEIDVKADGTQETIRPAKSGLARVSVLRGSGENEGKPFVDDYITIYDAIVDYKTQYSGIKPGDLNPRSSTHNLVPLKVSYKKLWLLLNLGCVFVGHGLASDFRKANIHVPETQTVDTQKLYQAPGKNRRLSLKYLAWAVFNEYIQEDSPDEAAQIEGHDSIEDARMALRLWRKFLEYKDAGVAQQMIDEIYRKGTRWNWKPPPRSGGLNIGEGMLTPAGGSGSAVPSGRNTPDMSSGSGIRVTMTGSPYRLPPTSGGNYNSSGNSVIRESPLR